MRVFIPDRFREVSILNIAFPKRAHHTINRAQIQNIGQFLDMENDLINYPNCGITTVKKMRNIVIDYCVSHMNDAELKKFLITLVKLNPNIKITCNGKGDDDE